MAHTPGPWYVERKYDGACTVAIMRDWSKSSCALAVHGQQAWIHAEDAGPETIEANARLIATAPDLFAVAKSLDEFQRTYEANAWDTMPGNSHYAGLLMAIVTSARAAIAKAEGR